MAREKPTFWYVYRFINKTKREIYHGVSKDPHKRVDMYHCEGATVTIAHWDCGRDKVKLLLMDTYKTQRAASRKAHERERKLRAPDGYAGYTLIETAGI